MATPGRKPKPPELALLAGDREDRERAARCPRPRSCLPKPPKDLPQAAVEEWYRMGRLLRQQKLLTRLDRPAFTAYCQVWARWREAEAEVLKGAVIRVGGKVDPVTGEVRGGYLMQNPYLAVANKALRQLQSLLAEFGMTPSSRARITVDREDDGDGFDDDYGI